MGILWTRNFTAGSILAVGILLTVVAAAWSQQKKSDPAYQAELERLWAAHPTLAIGSPAPEFDLPGTDGKNHTLGEYKNSPMLLIVFTCNHCPAAQLYEPRLKRIVTEYGPKGVALVAIQPNAPSAASARELNYTDVEDTLEGMKIRAKYRQFNFPYLYDGDNQGTVDKYGPRVTPHAFLFDRSRKLRYEGRVDDNMREALAKTHDLRDAMDALIAGNEVPVTHTPVFGCSTKYKSQVEGKQREAKAFQELPVTLVAAGVADLAKIRANATGKTVMVNFWATDCTPCVARFNDLLTTHLWYRSRDFELITVATDPKDKKAPVTAFLEQQHSAIRNLHFDGQDVAAVRRAFEQWQPGTPYVIVLGPGGKVVTRQKGEINLLALRRAILGVLPDGGFPGNSAYWAKFQR